MMSTTSLVGTVIDGKLHLGRVVASGGMAEVFEAVHLNLRMRVAVKVLRRGRGEGEERRLQRFLREARIAARLTSPHSVRVLDVATSLDGVPYMVMEFLEGETLGELLARQGQLPIPDAVEYMLQACEALAEMHAAGIIHRDVKPSNLFVVRDGMRECIKLLDFGIAAWDDQDEEQSLTNTHVAIGTPRYMAPEQLRSSKHVDARADVWSLAVTLYELLAGKPPFDGRNYVSLSHQIVNEEPKPLREVRPEVPATLAGIIHKCLAKEAAHRLPGITAMAAALAPFRSAPLPMGMLPTAPGGAPHSRSQRRKTPVPEQVATVEEAKLPALDPSLLVTANEATPLESTPPWSIGRPSRERVEAPAPRPRRIAVRVGVVALAVITTTLAVRGLRDASKGETSMLQAAATPPAVIASLRDVQPPTIELPREADPVSAPAVAVTREPEEPRPRAEPPPAPPRAMRSRGGSPSSPAPKARAAKQAAPAPRPANIRTIETPPNDEADDRIE